MSWMNILLIQRHIESVKKGKKQTGEIGLLREDKTDQKEEKGVSVKDWSGWFIKM